MSNKYFPSSSPDEMSPPKMAPDQESALDMHFNRNKTMHPSDVAILSAETGLTEEQVQVCVRCCCLFIVEITKLLAQDKQHSVLKKKDNWSLPTTQ